MLNQKAHYIESCGIPYYYYTGNSKYKINTYWLVCMFRPLWYNQDYHKSFCVSDRCHRKPNVYFCKALKCMYMIKNKSKISTCIFYIFVFCLNTFKMRNVFSVIFYKAFFWQHMVTYMNIESLLKSAVINRLLFCLLQKWKMMLKSGFS